ncbi:hypothetical protein D3H65_28585 [Paraflavitalea soli]|uniref:Uncharacterized protein n=1 Tax=Paraflavitalea soli TaxID=2315862 RepID=A0A3B7MUW2_9BACT|nr:hypothetical protein [Paraflavitalea soli]AXY77697.1 hypothetical protein D3H65_28585 [Paraflavitalea soli]
MSSLLINIAVIIFTVLITIFTLTYDTKTDGKLNGYGWCALVFCILVVGLSIYSTIDKEITDNDRFSYNIKKLDTIIGKADTTFLKIDSSTSLQYSLQDSTRKIDSIVTSQLLSQEILKQGTRKLLDSTRNISRRTKDIVITSGNILASTILQLKNAEAEFNPVYPFHIYVSYSLSFTEKSVSKLVDSLLNLKRKKEENISQEFRSVSFEIDIQKRVTNLSIKNYESYFGNIKELYSLDKAFQLGFIRTEDVGDIKQMPRFDKSILVCEALFRKSEVNHSAKKKISRLKVDFQKQEIMFNVYYTELYTFSYFDKSNKFFGVKDLFNSYMWITKVGISDCKLNAVSLYLGNQYNWPVYINMDESAKYNSKWNNYLIHKMQDFELFPKGYSIQDDYKILYYDSSTQSLGLPFPDEN